MEQGFCGWHSDRLKSDSDGAKSGKRAKISGAAKGGRASNIALHATFGFKSAEKLALALMA